MKIKEYAQEVGKHPYLTALALGATAGFVYLVATRETERSFKKRIYSLAAEAARADADALGFPDNG